MDEFVVTTKLWPGGTPLDLGLDTTTLSPAGPGASASFTRQAAPFVTSPAGTETYQFLFWNTGRRLTGKRKVRWLFSRFGWGVWTATKWYGTPGGGDGGDPRARADAFSVAGNEILPGSPIDAAASTFGAGAHPFNGDDHAVGTVAAGATLVAEPSLGAFDFAGWARLLWGGDPTDEFVETDADSTGSPGSSGFYPPSVDVGSAPFPVGMGESVDLLAMYVPHPLGFDEFFPVDFQSWLEFITPWLAGRKPDIIGDPSPMDLIRLAAVSDLLRRTRPGPQEGPDLADVIKRAPQMGKEELKRTRQSLETTLGLVQSALSTIDARLKSPGR